MRSLRALREGNGVGIGNREVRIENGFRVSEKLFFQGVEGDLPQWRLILGLENGVGDGFCLQFFNWLKRYFSSSKTFVFILP
jgi:hypothetical protein